MDYVDHRALTKKFWQKDKRSHHDRLDVILSSPSNRIDNKLSPIHEKAPCWKKPNPKSQKPKFNPQAHQHSLNLIKNRSISKEIIERIESISGYSTLSKKFRSSTSFKILKQSQSSCADKVKSNLSIKSWEKDFKRSLAYKKRISKPHVEKKAGKVPEKSPRKSKLIEVQLLRL